jgi:hypothetical protein
LINLKQAKGAIDAGKPVYAVFINGTKVRVLRIGRKYFHALNAIDYPLEIVTKFEV